MVAKKHLTVRDIAGKMKGKLTPEKYSKMLTGLKSAKLTARAKKTTLHKLGAI